MRAFFLEQGGAGHSSVCSRICSVLCLSAHQRLDRRPHIPSGCCSPGYTVSALGGRSPCAVIGVGRRGLSRPQLASIVVVWCAVLADVQKGVCDGLAMSVLGWREKVGAKAPRLENPSGAQTVFCYDPIPVMDGRAGSASGFLLVLVSGRLLGLY